MRRRTLWWAGHVDRVVECAGLRATRLQENRMGNWRENVGDRRQWREIPEKATKTIRQRGGTMKREIQLTRPR